MKPLKHFAVGIAAAALASIIYLSLPIAEPLPARPEPSLEASDLVRRHVESGKHLFSPGYGWDLQRRRSGWAMLVRLDSSSYYDPELLGVDGRDWSKLGGANYLSLWKPWTWPNNRLATMAVFRCAPKPYTFDIAGYVNDATGGFKWTEHITVSAGDLVSIDYDEYKGAATFEFWVGDSTYLSGVLPGHFERLQINIPPWHGGNEPAPVGLDIFTALRHK